MVGCRDGEIVQLNLVGAEIIEANGNHPTLRVLLRVLLRIPPKLHVPFQNTFLLPLSPC